MDHPASASCPSSPADGPGVRVVLVLFRAPDYPAAHSMDAHWYTVDARGNVAVFDADGSGPVPRKATSHESLDLLALVRQLGGDLPPPEDEDEDEDDFDTEDAYKELARLGVFVYYCVSWESDFEDPYVREHQPRRPMHLDQLPPKLRKEFARAPLPVPDFAAAREIQVVEHVPCEFYSDEAVGYYAVGHKEVRPIPGREQEYRAALPGFRKEYPKLRFADIPAAPGHRPKKGKKP